MSATTWHRLDGLEPDNLLAVLALLGLLRAIEADEASHTGEPVHPRAAWDIDVPPLRPLLCLAKPATPDEIAERAANGVELLARDHDFGERKDLNYPRDDARLMLSEAAEAATAADSGRADLLAALMTDGAIKTKKKDLTIDPTPLCLLFGQGHQHFLERLAKVPHIAAPPSRERKKTGPTVTSCLAETLFEPWHRNDPTFSFRWDPDEDVHYALMAGDPTVAAYKLGTQHGANRLAAIGLAVLTVVPQARGDRVRATLVGGSWDRGGFSMAWPIWREPASLTAIRAMLAHPSLRDRGALAHLGVEYVMTARRISVGKFMNFSRAELAI